MKQLSEKKSPTLISTENEKETISINIEHFINNHIREGGEHQSNMVARREIGASTEVENFISDHVSTES